MRVSWAQIIIVVLVATAECKLLYHEIYIITRLCQYFFAINSTGRVLTQHVIFISSGSNNNIIQLGQGTTLECTVRSTVPGTVTVDWSTTALSANISNQTVDVFGSFVIEILNLANVDSGYCGVYTCTVTDSDMMPLNTSTSISVGK